MLGGKLFGFDLTLKSAWPNQNDFCSKRCSRFALDRWSIPGHDDYSFRVEGSSGISNALRMIPAGVGDHAASAFLVGQRRNFVVSPAELERTDGLKMFGLEVESAAFVLKGNQRRADSDAVEEGAGFADFVEAD